MNGTSDAKGNDKPEPVLENLPELVGKRVQCYENLDRLQQFGMFMGKAQILELTLKNVLTRRFGHDLDAMEKWTLGRVKNELKDSGVRPDFIGLLESLIELRNFIAHEFVAAEMILLDAVGQTGRLNLKHLHRGIWEVEQLLLIVEWQEQHNGWQ